MQVLGVVEEVTAGAGATVVVEAGVTAGVEAVVMVVADMWVHGLTMSYILFVLYRSVHKHVPGPGPPPI